MIEFPVIGTTPKEYVPFDIVARHEAQALRNHGQTLERLAERGGLDWGELYDVLTDQSSRRHSKAFDYKAAVLDLVAGCE